MPKIIDYPRASMKASLMLANAVQDLGGTCTVAMAAEKMGKKIGGGFKAIVSASTKYGFVTHKASRLSVTASYRNYRLAYSAEERDKVLRASFLSIPLFKGIYERFKTQKLPIEHFEKLLIREFEVQDQIASRVATYFIDGSKQIGLLNPDNSFNSQLDEERDQVSGENQSNDDGTQLPAESESMADADQQNSAEVKLSRGYSVRIYGPGIDSVIQINEEDDLAIVEIMLKKVRKKLLEDGRTDDNAKKIKQA